MSVKKYTNLEEINNKTENEGKFLQSEDLFIVSQGQIEDTDFGDCKYDVMEVSVYDINNNLLPQKSGKNVAYIKTGDIKNYMYNLTKKGGLKELAIDVEKLLNDLGFSNGILKININFVRNKVGSDNELTRVWLQEISPSRTEARILPLKTPDNNINSITNREFTNINNLSKDFKYYKKNLLDSLDSMEYTITDSVINSFISQFGNDYRDVLRKDFGLSDFNGFVNTVYKNIKASITYYVTNRYYDITQSNFGQPSEIRFNDCDQYDYTMISAELSKIMRICIDANTKVLKRRDIPIKVLPKEFEITELKKEVKNLVDTISIPQERIRDIYNPANVAISANGTEEIVSTKVVETTTWITKEVEIVKPDPVNLETVEQPNTTQTATNTTDATTIETGPSTDPVVIEPEPYEPATTTLSKYQIEAQERIEFRKRFTAEYADEIAAMTETYNVVTTPVVTESTVVLDDIIPVPTNLVMEENPYTTETVNSIGDTSGDVLVGGGGDASYNPTVGEYDNFKRNTLSITEQMV